MVDYLKDLMKKVKESSVGEQKPEIDKIKEQLKEDIKTSEPSKAEKRATKSDDLIEKVSVQEEKPVEKKAEGSLLSEEEPSYEDKADVSVKSATEKKFEQAKKVLISSYGEAKIYKVEGEPLLYYYVPVPRPTGSERAIINTIKEAATRLISIAPYKIRDPQERRNVYYQRVIEILRESPDLKVPERRWSFYADAVVREMVGYGIIDSLVKDDKLEEIMVIGPQKPVYGFHREYEMVITNVEFYSDKEIQDLINRIARLVGRRVDLNSPLLDARLPDGSRVNATIPPASVDGSTLTIRKFRADPYSIIDLISVNTMSAELAAFLWLCVEGMGVKPANILIAGGTGSGKTTTLNVLASFIPSSERVITMEDTAELSLPLKHWIRMEGKPPSLEGTGEITLDVLTKNSLRMRPDRIIVGEIRHDEAFSLFTAMNTGHDGSMGTVHANSPSETIVRITSPPMSVPEIMLSGLDFIIVEHRIHDKKKGTIRRITEVAEISGVLEGKARTQTIFEWNAPKDSIERTQVPVSYINELEKFTGLKKKQIEAEVNERAEFLQKLLKSGIREIGEVSRRCEQYLLSKREENAKA